jgi:hypothetical protein
VPQLRRHKRLDVHAHQDGRRALLGQPNAGRARERWLALPLRLRRLRLRRCLQLRGRGLLLGLRRHGGLLQRRLVGVLVGVRQQRARARLQLQR